MKSIVFSLFLLTLINVESVFAIRQGAVTSTLFIKMYEQQGEWGKAALWQEAAIECLLRISVPMNALALKYYTSHNHPKWVKRCEQELSEILAQRQSHLNQAQTAWKKSKTPAEALKAERKKIAKFISRWVAYYPERFYELGIYPTFFREQRERAAEKGDDVQMLLVEADAAELCAALYDKIPIAYGLKRYEAIRDAYARRARWLRTLASQNRSTLREVVGRKINLAKVGTRYRWKGSEYINRVSTAVLAAAIVQIAKSDSRVTSALARHQGIREYAQFQGNVWTVSFSNQGWGNLAVAIVNHETGRVLDVICK